MQAAAGTDDFAAMERFLGVLEGDDSGPSGGVTPSTLFDGVRMEPARSTLRRAAIVFAGRIPTEEEYASIKGGGIASLRAAIRGLMTGPGFHEFLIRGANDRLLTDRYIEPAIRPSDNFLDYTNKRFEVAQRAAANGRASDVNAYEDAVDYGARRAPLELIAHVAENDLPYTEILTADYIMANPLAAEAYGSATSFDDAEDVHEFRPSEILSYYRVGEEFEYEDVPGLGRRILNPGPLSTDYPHAGILNTRIFLQRYPTTPTNRNRARSRWTYYHFLGLDVEKSASRTTDPVALADTNNPTMHNPACTVCHAVLDPVAGAFQNFGDDGLYRRMERGLSALDFFYRRDFVAGRDEFEVTARSRESRQTLAVEAVLPTGASYVRLTPRFDPPLEGNDAGWGGGFGDVRVLDRSGAVVDRVDLVDLYGVQQPNVDSEWLCGTLAERSDGQFFRSYFCPQRFPIEVGDADSYTVEVEAWLHEAWDVDERSRVLTMDVGVHQPGDTWYRDMSDPGFGSERVPDADTSLSWLAHRIVADPRFAESTVTFWWPAIMGAEVAAPPADAGDVDFQGRLLAANAQGAEVKRLANGFRRGFHGREPYNLKDLLVEIVLSKWFRAASMEGGDPTLEVALNDAGAPRLLTPEELARKTDAITGYQWERRVYPSAYPFDQQWSALTHNYRPLYGGIDSDGVIRRQRALTSVMAGVAKRHAAAASCPIVMREFFLLPDEERRLFRGIDRWTTPTLEFRERLEVEADSASGQEALAVTGWVNEGQVGVKLSFVNSYYVEGGDDSNLYLDRLTVRNADGQTVASVELENVEDGTCQGRRNDHFAFYCNSSIRVPVDVSASGNHEFEVLAYADQAGDEHVKLDIAVESNAETSAGSRAIREKLVELHDVLLGIKVAADSEDVDAAYRLFVDFWQRAVEAENDRQWRSDRECRPWDDIRYFDGIVEGLVEVEEHDDGLRSVGWNSDRMTDFLWGGEVDWSNPGRTAGPWVAVLFHLMTDYRYLHL